MSSATLKHRYNNVILFSFLFVLKKLSISRLNIYLRWINQPIMLYFDGRLAASRLHMWNSTAIEFLYAQCFFCFRLQPNQ